MVTDWAFVICPKRGQRALGYVRRTGFFFFFLTDDEPPWEEVEEKRGKSGSAQG